MVSVLRIVLVLLTTAVTVSTAVRVKLAMEKDVDGITETDVSTEVLLTV